MAATPQSCTFILRAMNGSTKALDAYVSDVANASVRFDSGAGSSSTSDTFWIAPVDCIIEDFAMVTGTADTTRIQVVKNAVSTGQILRYTVHLTSLNNRPRLAIPLKAGDKLSATQLA